MAWPYKFIELDEAARISRRQVLDRYGFLAHGSVLIVLATFFFYRIAVLLVKRFKRNHTSYAAVPGSPGLKRQRQNAFGSWIAVARKTAWWLEDDVNFLGQNWGQRAEFIFGSIWTLWLLFLCINGTGNGEFTYPLNKRLDPRRPN